jgi:phage regulator Rha-like protein
MFLVMNISTKKAHDKKIQFIDAFNAMEKALLQKTNVEWNKTREL